MNLPATFRGVEGRSLRQKLLHACRSATFTPVAIFFVAGKRTQYFTGICVESGRMLHICVRGHGRTQWTRNPDVFNKKLRKLSQQAVLDTLCNACI